MKKMMLMDYAGTVTMTLPLGKPSSGPSRTAGSGVGILSEIEVRPALSTKLGEDAASGVGDSVILGACNPSLAHHALAVEPEIGLLLPCNVVVRRAPGHTVTTVQAIDPRTIAQLSGEPESASIAEDAGRRLRAAMDALHAGP